MADRGFGSGQDDSEARERARDRFVWWTNGMMILLILGIFVIPALTSDYLQVAP